ncbi:FAD-dependent oxidoreductase [Geminicoccus roseus]|uniref:FAD-dependent oxidoreductase n=1 Tax=Geminicoccus roseus TaxID=404900 RepID=UPI0003F5E617|nr:GMC family oxidoreductase [Geminicoccus roseus]
MISDGLDGLDEIRHDVCIVGSGPVGLSLAMELARKGKRVLLLESGHRKPDEDIQALSDATIVDPAVHDDVLITVARRLGGTSNLWGARCQPYDPIDFVPRPQAGEVDWPIRREDLLSFYDRACHYANCGSPVFSRSLEGITCRDNRVDIRRVERFSNKPIFQLAHAAELDGNAQIDIRLNATVVDIAFEGEEATKVTVCRPDGARQAVPVRTVVLAMGGLESTRLMLSVQRREGHRFGGLDGPLGRNYMGHLIGEVADVTFANDEIDRAFDFHVDEHGSYSRHRMIPSDECQLNQGLLNVSFWPVVPPVDDPTHQSGILSLAALAMSIKPIGRLLVAEAIRRYHAPENMKRSPHVVNVTKGLPSVLSYIPQFFYKRYFAEMRLPGFFLRNPGRRYGLSYHAEQSPHPDSRVTLGDEVDRLGLPRLVVDLRFRREDGEALFRAHQVIRDWLQKTGLGSLVYRQPENETVDAIMSIASHGTHQIGLARMGSDPRKAIVDADLRCFGTSNVYVAGSAVLPTSGQANPTLTAIALAVRLADHLSQADRQRA